METRAKQGLTRLGTSTSLDLLKRQLHEWKTLLQNQKQARRWIMDEPRGQKYFNLQNMMLYRRVEQLNQLSLLTAHQSEERQQLHLRHQQEVAELNQLLATYQPGLASS
jgi:hypothetical protein